MADRQVRFPYSQAGANRESNPGDRPSCRPTSHGEAACSEPGLPSREGEHNLPVAYTGGRRLQGDGHRSCKCGLLCKSCECLGQHCRRASCSLFCHRLFLLDVRALLLEVFEARPDLQPDLEVRISGHDMSLDEYREFRRTLTDEFSRAKIPYGMFTSFDPFPHDAGFVRGVRRRAVVRAIRRAARRCGVSLTPGRFAVAPIRVVAGYVRNLTKAEEVVGPAPRYYRVFTASRRFLPISLGDGRTWMWMLRASHPDPRKRVGFMPSSKTLERILWNVQVRRELEQ